MGEHGLIKRINKIFYSNDSFPFEIFKKHGGDDHDLY
jgi:hypothetical protein